MKRENNKKNPELNIRIEGKNYEWNNQFITGEQLKKIAKIPLTEELYLSLTDPWDDELIPNDQSVDLARPGIENFYIRPILKFKIDKKLVSWNEQYITGLQLRALGSISNESKIYLKIKGKFEDDLIDDNEKVNLARPGIEKFYSKDSESEIVIITIDEVEYETPEGDYTGLQLKEIGNVNKAYELEQVINGLKTIGENDIVSIVGGEVFISHPKDGQSS